MKPRILLSISRLPNIPYIKAVQAVGAEPSAFYVPRLDPTYDALILCGGADIDPSRYDQENTASVEIDQDRDSAEFELFEMYKAQNKPILGICRGHQLLNVAMGSFLVQHLENAHLHSSSVAEYDLIHQVSADKNGFVGRLYGENFVTNSYHHQGVVTPAKDLRAVAWSEDGKIIEALEHEFLPIISVQWHPEQMCCDYIRTDTVNGIGVFEYFIDLCKQS